jgi:hypothetical protein
MSSGVVTAHCPASRPMHATEFPGGYGLELARTVGIGAVLDGHEISATGLVVDAVVAAARAVQAFHAEPEGLPARMSRRTSSSLITCVAPALISATPSRLSPGRSSLAMTSSISSSDSRSVALITTAAGCPCLVITTLPCSRCTTSTTSGRSSPETTRPT